MTNSPTRWDVVTTVRERPEVLDHFVQHYLGQGCNQLHIYFDDPADPDMTRLAGDPRLRLIPSVTPRLKRDGSQISHGRRQSDNATNSLKHSTADWIIHLDADELLTADTTVAEQLASLPQEVVQARVRPSEALFADFEAAQIAFNAQTFRRAIYARKDEALAGEVYGEAQELLRKGLSGHAVGKSFLRRGRGDAKGSIHAWKDPGTDDWLPEHDIDRGMELKHFDAISYEIWKEKFAKRINGVVQMSGKSPNRLRQVEIFSAAFKTGDEAALQALFCQVYVLSPLQIEQLTTRGYAWRVAVAANS